MEAGGSWEGAALWGEVAEVAGLAWEGLAGLEEGDRVVCSLVEVVEEGVGAVVRRLQ